MDRSRHYKGKRFHESFGFIEVVDAATIHEIEAPVTTGEMFEATLRRQRRRMGLSVWADAGGLGRAGEGRGPGQRTDRGGRAAGAAGN